MEDGFILPSKFPPLCALLNSWHNNILLHKRTERPGWKEKEWQISFFRVTTKIYTKLDTHIYACSAQRKKYITYIYTTK